MSILARITNPKKPKNKYVSVVAIILAAILIVVSLWQLYSLDDFLNTIVGYNIPGGDGFATFLGCSVIALQIFSLPFLLSMDLSAAMRFCSMFGSWLMMVIYIFLWYWASVYSQSLSTFDDWVVAGWLLLPFIIVGMLVVVSSWGMWPSFDRSSFRK